MVTQNKIPFFNTSILYLCGMFLFLEWLYPVEEIGDVNNLIVFIIFTLFCFLISLLRITWWTTLLIKAAGLLFIINELYFKESFLSQGWLQRVSMEFSFNIQSLFARQWGDMTDLFRSFLFLLLIWLMSYLIYYWFIVMKRIFLFVFLTFLYIALLDTFTAYDASLPMVRTFVLSFMALGLTHFFKEIDKEVVGFAWLKKMHYWFIPIAVFILISSLIGYAAPKFDPQWPDPVPFLISKAKNADDSDEDSGTRKVGYGEDDSKLGGSFLQDYSPVFQAASTKEHYWRIETKDEYTGKGWQRSTDADYEAQQNAEISLRTFSENVEIVERTARLEFQENTEIEKLVYPYGITRVEAIEEAQFLLDAKSGAIQTQVHNENASLKKYTLSYLDPSFAIDELRGTKGKDPVPIQTQYTNVPESLPKRVGQLAEEITASQTNRYDKARAIEQHFGKSGFAYQTEDVPFPEEEEDYVDQFLFETKAGYCDNYSTSMVVMLRTLDIPARWAKGFTSGEKIATDVGENVTNPTDEPLDLYEVTNSNAHSWVEVYFPEIGWVPFEPTQGFNNLSEFHQTNSDQEDEETPDDTEEELDEEEENELEDEEKAVDNEKENSFQVNVLYLGLGLLILLLVIFILYKTRLRWKTYILLWKFKKKGNEKTFEEAYHHLLAVLSSKGLAKEPDQTLREYAKQVDLRYGTNEMGQLTTYYEQMLYTNELKVKKANERIDIWESLMKRVMERR